MNLVWHSWQNILREVAATQGLDYDLNQVEAPAARKIAQAVNAAVDIAWKFHQWPGTCWVARQLDSETTDPTVLFEPGHSVLALYNEDPIAAWDAGTDPEMVNVRETSGRYLQQGTDPSPRFWLVRTPPPRFGTAQRSAATAYKPGDLAYDPATGEAWRCVIAHTNTAFPTWQEWTLQVSNFVVQTYKVRRNGVLYTCIADHEASATNEPNMGSGWLSAWTDTIHVWAPQRIPDFLLQAVIHGARVWLQETPALPRSAMEKQMDGWLCAEVDDLRLNRRQRFVLGAGATVL